ncbi:DUF4242 domain-containing protein [Brevibacillus composti]|uniref:DUF4242 domain-containing protein n=1 Tax=Brevibacillus composti TaxID=2796470 RepID=A0A7T5JNT5_9BACL|nr:DUF4242 domain-containing protein [Brevibacillus composti]QQE74355.1 DUF4242 domain-containing protein [Brevibacillus composti]QUO41437.1 DUF4242 domain-containing protein [Brevibacillus composti]
MSLYLVESVLHGIVQDQESFEQKIADLQEQLAQKQIHLIEVQVSKDFARAFFIFESEERSVLNESLRAQGVPVALIKPVRLVGSDLDEVKKQADRVNYLVEWNLPENLTMEQYLDRKSKNSVHYAEVPEVSFSRTYVCEDMTKCLCFYQAPDEAAVKKAREAVKAPIDTITEIASGK